jgi:hypothetical protein
MLGVEVAWLVCVQNSVLGVRMVWLVCVQNDVLVVKGENSVL